MQYQEILQKLLELEESQENSAFYVTCYLPSEFEHRQDFTRYIKSQLLDKFRAHKELKALGEYHSDIVDNVLESFKAVEDFKSGVAIFIKFSKEDLEKNNDLKLFAFPLTQKPTEEIFIGNSFDVDQLLWVENFNTFSILLEEENTKIFFLKDGKIEKVQEFDNEFIDADIRTGMTRASGGLDQSFGVIGSTDNFGNEQNKHFFKEICEWLKENISKYDVNYLVFFMSPRFQELKDAIESNLSELKKTSKIFINKIIKTNDEILDSTWNGVIEKNRKSKKELLENVKEQYPLYVEGWPGVIKAANENRIEKLFTEAAAKEEGFIDENNLFHLGKVDGAKPTSNIAPWIIKKVLDSAGEVIVFKEQKVGDQPIGAKLRY